MPLAFANNSQYGVLNFALTMKFCSNGRISPYTRQWQYNYNEKRFYE